MDATISSSLTQFCAQSLFYAHSNMVCFCNCLSVQLKSKWMRAQASAHEMRVNRSLYSGVIFFFASRKMFVRNVLAWANWWRNELQQISHVFIGMALSEMTTSPNIPYFMHSITPDLITSPIHDILRIKYSIRHSNTLLVYLHHLEFRLGNDSDYIYILHRINLIALNATAHRP